MMLGAFSMMGWGCGPFGTQSGFFGGFFFMLLFWGLVIWAVVSLVHYLSGDRTKQAKEGKALEILKERYAKGELTKEEFEVKKKDVM